MSTAWAGERVTRSWQRNTREGEVTLDTETTTVEPMPDPGWPYYHPHEEWPARPYHGGTPYVMAPAPPASQTQATAHVPDGPTRLDIPGSHYSKPGQKYRPGDNWFINSGLNLPNGVIETPEPEPVQTPQERTWTEWGEQMLNDGIDAFANLTWEDFWESMKLTCPPLGMIEDGINHFSTVYTNMLSNEPANYSVFFAAAVAGGSVLARWTGVENLSYFWESTDPVTGEEYNRWQRFGYGILGTGQLFVSAFGIQQFGKMAVGTIQNALKTEAAAMKTKSASTAIKTEQAELGRKLEYIFGNATGRSHNIERSSEMLRQLEKIGLHDTPMNRAYIAQHLQKILNDRSNIIEYTKKAFTVRESLLMGPNGAVKLQSIWEGNILRTILIFGE